MSFLFFPLLFFEDTPINENVDTYQQKKLDPINENVDTYQQKKLDPINENVDTLSTKRLKKNNTRLILQDEYIEREEGQKNINIWGNFPVCSALLNKKLPV